MNAIENAVEMVKDWNKARETANLIHQVQDEYVGCVVHDMTEGRDAIITRMTWESTVWNVALHRDGQWVCRIRYLNDGTETEATPSVFALTSKRYTSREAIDAARPVHPLYASVQ